MGVLEPLLGLDDVELGLLVIQRRFEGAGGQLVARLRQVQLRLGLIDRAVAQFVVDVLKLVQRVATGPCDILLRILLGLDGRIQRPGRRLHRTVRRLHGARVVLRVLAGVLGRGSDSLVSLGDPAQAERQDTCTGTHSGEGGGYQQQRTRGGRGHPGEHGEGGNGKRNTADDRSAHSRGRAARRLEGVGYRTRTTFDTLGHGLGGELARPSRVGRVEVGLKLDLAVARRTVDIRLGLARIGIDTNSGLLVLGHLLDLGLGLLGIGLDLDLDLGALEGGLDLLLPPPCGVPDVLVSGEQRTLDTVSDLAGLGQNCDVNVSDACYFATSLPDIDLYASPLDVVLDGHHLFGVGLLLLGLLTGTMPRLEPPDGLLWILRLGTQCDVLQFEQVGQQVVSDRPAVVVLVE